MTKYAIAVLAVMSAFAQSATAWAADDNQPAAADPKAEEAKELITEYLSDTKFKDIKDDLLVPSSPAFAILGVSPDNIIRPSNPKEFGAALLNGVDPSGTLQTGLALELSPNILFGGRSVSLHEYRTQTWRRIMARTQISVATTRAGSDGDKTVRTALGFRTVLLDRGDVRWNAQFKDFADVELQKLTTDALRTVGVKYGARMCEQTVARAQTAEGYLQLVKEATCPPVPAELRGQLTRTTNLDEKVESTDSVSGEKKIRDIILESLKGPEEAVSLESIRKVVADEWNVEFENFRKNAWNATNVTIGGAVTHASTTGKFSDLGKPGYAVYATGAYGFEDMKGSGLEDNAHFIAHVRYQTNQLVTAVKVGATPYSQDLLTVGAQIRLRGPELTAGKDGRTLVFFGEYDYMHASPKTMAATNYYRYSAGAEIALTDEVHLQISTGQETGTASKSSATFVLGDFKYSF